ncbi:calcium-binding and coiled-coil domain-containing protein 1 [Narcine bancroftii]|uniref:calcium-binding and coiled-coil domain-containing protein 1 n=1 Tax=Narcine bancroftii TaxID=1343680 RepID=UPI003831FD0B
MEDVAIGLLKEVEAAKNIHKEEEWVTEEGPAVVQHTIGFRRKQKMMFRQMKQCALLLDLVKNSDVNAIQEVTQQEDIQLKINKIRQRWKSLKSECQVQEEELQNMSAIMEKFQALEAKQQTLRNAVQLYKAKKQQLEEAAQQKRLKLKEEQKLGLSKEIERSILECSQSLKKCQALMQQAQQEVQLLAQGVVFNYSVRPCDFHTYSQLHEILEMQSGLKVLEVCEDQVTLQLNPQRLIPLTKLAPLVLTVNWTDSGTAHLKTNCAFLDLSKMESVDLPNITAETCKLYISQAELWAEIQSLQYRYAIDWLEKERKLKFLHSVAGSSSNIVYTLYVEPGYPHNGEIKLSSVRQNKKLIDMVAKPPQDKPLLSDWLEYLNDLVY